MKSGRCVRCACVKRGSLCVDCWPSTLKPSRCTNSPEVAWEPVNSCPAHQADTTSQLVIHQSTSEPTSESTSELTPDNPTQDEIRPLSALFGMPIKTLKRVPRLSRVSAARKLASAVEQVVSRNDLQSWVRLLSFPKKCLCTPARGGKRWNLTTIINKQVIQESPITAIPDQALHHAKSSKAKPSKNHMDYLASRVSSKLEEGDYRGAVRLACSEDVIADPSEETLHILRSKHPPSPPDSAIPVLDSTSPLTFAIDTQLIMRVISSFPKGSSSGSDGLLPQHLKDLTSPSAGDGGTSLLSALVGLTTLILEGRTSNPICPLFFGANSTTLKKKCGGIRPIAVGCTLRRLATKCDSLHALEKIPQLLAPHQLGFGISRGVEAAVHATRVYLN